MSKDSTSTKSPDLKTRLWDWVYETLEEDEDGTSFAVLPDGRRVGPFKDQRVLAEILFSEACKLYAEGTIK